MTTANHQLRNIGTIAQGRREFLIAGAAAALLPAFAASEPAQTVPGAAHNRAQLDSRTLGNLVVSGIGLGVQNMSRKYETTVPYRPEMLNVIRTAFDQGVTFFDAAEAYGPFEVERILGEGVAAFRDQVVIATKFGWNIDPQTGERRPGLNSRPVAH